MKKYCLTEDGKETIKEKVVMLLFVGAICITAISFIAITSIFVPTKEQTPLFNAWGYISLAALISYLTIGLKRWLQKSIKEC